MSRSEALLLWVLHGNCLDALPQKARSVLAPLFVLDNRPSDHEQWMEAVIANAGNEPAGRLSNGDLEDK